MAPLVVPTKAKTALKLSSTINVAILAGLQDCSKPKGTRKASISAAPPEHASARSPEGW
jgi:hypothetical protein